MHVLLLTDTHLGPGRAEVLHDRLGRLLHEADAIVHAGDITDPSVLELLAAHAPAYTVLGNNDDASQFVPALPERLEVTLGSVRFAVVHDSGAAAGRTARLRRWFPDADVVVFGHSHLPWHEIDRRADGHVQHHINPGSATVRRRAPAWTAAVVEIADGAVGTVHHVTLPPR